MLYPSVQELTNEKVNRYMLVIATAKGARKITQEAVEERERQAKIAAESGERSSSRDSKNEISADSVNEKAVSSSVQKFYTGEFKIKFD